jgi:hypothetical protein
LIDNEGVSIRPPRQLFFDEDGNSLWSLEAFPFGARIGEARPHPLADQLAFEFCDGSEKVGEHPAHGVVTSTFPFCSKVAV